MSFFKPSKKDEEKYSNELKDILEGKGPKKIEPKKLEARTIDYNLIIQPQAATIAGITFYASHLAGRSHLQFPELFTDHLPVDLHMRIKIDSLEDKLPESLKATALNIYVGVGEWVRELIELKENKILIHPDPTGFAISNDNYIAPPLDMDFRQKADSFSITNGVEKLELNVYNNIEKVARICPELIVRLYSKPYEKLPPKIQEEGKIKIPDAGKIFPLHAGIRSNPYAISYGLSQEKFASRGCKPK